VLLSSSLKVFICIWVRVRVELDHGRGSMAYHAMVVRQSFEVFFLIYVFSLLLSG
jgi:hypothetical protein